MRPSPARIARQHLAGRGADWPKWDVQLTPDTVRMSTFVDRWDSDFGGITISDAFEAKNFTSASKPIVQATQGAAERLFNSRIAPILAKYQRKWTGKVYHNWEFGRITPVGGSRRVYLMTVSFPITVEGPSTYEIEQELRKALP